MQCDAVRCNILLLRCCGVLRCVVLMLYTYIIIICMHTHALRTRTHTHRHGQIEIKHDKHALQ